MNRLALILSILGTSAALAEIHHVVPPDTPGVIPTPGYTSWATAATSIQDAVAAATNGSLVLVSNGTYLLSGPVVITNRITVRSFNNGNTDPEGTVVDGQWPAALTRCFVISNAPAVVDGFTITNGFASPGYLGGNGGGVWMRKGIVTNCIIAGNQSAASGGGVFIDLYGTVTCSRVYANLASNTSCVGGGIFMNTGGTVSNCWIATNRAWQGGGVYMYLNGGQVIGCTVVSNWAKPAPLQGGAGGSGGGIQMTHAGTIADCLIAFNSAYASTGGSGSSATCGGAAIGSGGLMRDCVIEFNTALNGYGGGVQAGNGRTLLRTMVRNNTASSGGGVYMGVGGLMQDCTIVSNSSAMFVQGGTVRNCLVAYNPAGIYAFSGGVGTYQNCTIVSNGYGLSFGYGNNVLTPGYVENCIVYHNGSTGTNWFHTANAPVVFTNTCTLPLPDGPSDTGNITNAPVLLDTVRGNFRLAGNSPCINAGVWRAWMTNAWDLDRRARLDKSGVVDLGAYEFVPRGTFVLVR